MTFAELYNATPDYGTLDLGGRVFPMPPFVIKKTLTIWNGGLVLNACPNSRNFLLDVQAPGVRVENVYFDSDVGADKTYAICQRSLDLHMENLKVRNLRSTLYGADGAGEFVAVNCAHYGGGAAFASNGWNTGGQVLDCSVDGGEHLLLGSDPKVGTPSFLVEGGQILNTDDSGVYTKGSHLTVRASKKTGDVYFRMIGKDPIKNRHKDDGTHAGSLHVDGVFIQGMGVIKSDGGLAIDGRCKTRVQNATIVMVDPEELATKGTQGFVVRDADFKVRNCVIHGPDTGDCKGVVSHVGDIRRNIKNVRCYGLSVDYQEV